MVANQLRTVFNQTLPRPRAVLAGGATSQIRVVFEVWFVDPKTLIEARAEVRDRETYYAELRFAVHCQSRSIPLPRTALDDQETDKPKRRPHDESWDDMTARFGDTWT
jgi:hypothetical protein